MTHGLAEEAVTQCWIPAAPHPPAAPAIAATWSPRELRPPVLVPVGMLGALSFAHGGSLGTDAFGRAG